MELERLDEMLLALWPSARRGAHGAIGLVLAIQDRRARYLGLDAPRSLDLQVKAEFGKVAGALDLDPAELLTIAEEIVANGRSAN
jgi:hypothetical protein